MATTFTRNNVSDYIITLYYNYSGLGDRWERLGWVIELLKKERKISIDDKQICVNAFNFFFTECNNSREYLNDEH